MGSSEVEVPESWKDAADEGLATPHIADGGRADAIAFAKNIQAKVNAQEGNTLPVSAFNDYIMDLHHQEHLHTRNVVSQ